MAMKGYCIPKSSNITGTSDCLVSYPGLSLEESYPSVENQSVYFLVLADWASLQRNAEKEPVTAFPFVEYELFADLKYQ